MANLANLFIAKQIYDSDIILVCFVYFPSFLLSFLTNIKGAKDTNIGNP